MSSSAIADVFRTSFQRNIRVTYAVLLALTIGLFGVYLNARRADAEEVSWEYLKKNEDYLLALAIYNNEEALRTFMEGANRSQSAVRYTWVPEQEAKQKTSDVYPIQMGEKRYGAIRAKIQFFSLIEPEMFFALLFGAFILLFIPIQFYRRTQRFIQDNVVQPLHEMSLVASKSTSLKQLVEVEAIQTEVLEIQQIRKALAQAADEISYADKSLREAAIASALNRVAAQVSHDIRSPLTALEVVTGMLVSVPEDKKQIIRAATQRIRDIANNLLEKHKEIAIQSKSEPEGGCSVFIPPIVERLVSEKRWQYGKQTEKQVEFVFGKNPLEIFVRVDRVELQRVVSNLMNNAIEALDGKGRVVVSVDAEGPNAIIRIQDNGGGIPPDVLSRLGEVGVSHGKDGEDSGTGLGVHHALQFARNSGGQLNFESQIGKGTTVSLSLPLVAKPKWHFDRLKLSPTTPIVLVDDDPGMKSVWRAQLDKRVSGWSGVLFTFENGASFEKERVRQGAAWDDAIFLMDFELRDSPVTGLDLIERNGLQSKAVLVTSRFDEVEVQERCRRMGVSLLPKGMISLVPIDVATTQTSPRLTVVKSTQTRDLPLQ